MVLTVAPGSHGEGFLRTGSPPLASVCSQHMARCLLPPGTGAVATASEVTNYWTDKHKQVCVTWLTEHRKENRKA